MCPIQVSGHQAHPTRPPGAPDQWRIPREVQHRAQPFGVDGAGDADHPSDVLLVDHAVGDRDHSPESRCQTAWFEMASHERRNLLRRPVGKFGDTQRVDAIDTEPALEEATDQRRGTEFVVADCVDGDIADPPKIAQRRAIPLLGRQAFQ